MALEEECPTYPLKSTGLPNGGMNISPELSWTPGPEGTLSYAIVLTDTSINQVHWALWDIPASVTTLEEGVATTATLMLPTDSKTASNFNQKNYFGSGKCGNVYEHRVYALNVAKLTGTPTVMTIKAELEKVDLASSYIKSQSRTSDTGCN